MRAFKTVFFYELNKFFRSKVYLIITGVLMLGVIAAGLFPRITAMFSSGDSADRKGSIIWLQLSEEMLESEEDQAGNMYLAVFSEAFKTNEVKLVNEPVEEIFEEITDGNISCAFVLNSPVSYTYYTNNAGLYDYNTETADEALQKAYSIASLKSVGLNLAQIQTALTAKIITHETKSLGKNQRASFLYTYVMIMALYMVILYYGQGVASSVAAEKSSRAMELLITSVKPIPMMFGKILSSSVAGLVQLFCVFETAIVSFHFSKIHGENSTIMRSLFNVPASLLGYMLLFFLLGFLIYAFLYGATGSTATKLEEVGQATGPVTILFIIGFIVTVQSLIGNAISSLPVKIFSFIPFTSPMVMFARIAMSIVPAMEIVLSVVILIVSTALVGILSAKIYRAGVLIYGTRPKLNVLIKTVLQAK